MERLIFCLMAFVIYARRTEREMNGRPSDIASFVPTRDLAEIRLENSAVFRFGNDILLT